MLTDEFKKAATKKITAMSANEYKKAFKDIGSELQTNEEWLHTLNTEQLADAIYDLLIDRQWDSWSWKLNGMVLRDIHEHGNTKSTKAIMEWLKQPHTPFS